MQFSIRQILYLMVAVALGILMISKLVGWMNNRAEIALLTAKIDSESFSEQLNLLVLPYREDDAAIDSGIDQVMGQAVTAFDQIQNRHGLLKIESDVSFSLISIPTLAVERAGAHINKWRFYVPDDQSIFLKVGVQEDKPDQNNFRNITRDSKFVDRSSFDPSGPLELRMVGGQHDLLTTWDKSDDAEFFSFEIQLDKQVIFRTRFANKNLDGTIVSGVTLASQKNYQPKSMLPTLIRIKPSHGILPNSRQSAETILVWVSRESSGFKPMNLEVVDHEQE